MIFRCASLLFPIKCRNVTNRPFYITLGLITLVTTAIAALPFFPVPFIDSQFKYRYNPNLGECSYQISTDYSSLIVLVDIIYWGPFLLCLLSSIVFYVGMNIHTAKLQSKKTDVCFKTLILTAFFIMCYLPRQFESLGFYMMGRSLILTWAWFEQHVGFTALVYIHTVCTFIIPLVRAAFTPLVLRLPEFISMSDRRRGKRRSTKDRLSVFARTGELLKAQGFGGGEIKLERQKTSVSNIGICSV